MGLKDPVKIWQNDNDGKIPCYLAAMVMEKKWRNESKKYKSIIQAITAMNRAWNNVNKNKSSNVYSNYQQAFCNKYNIDRGIKTKSKRQPIELDTLNTDWNKELKEIIKI